MPIPKDLFGLIKHMLILWQRYIETRQRAYERKMDKKQEKALNIAERGLEEMDELFDFVYNNLPMSEDQEKEYFRLRKKFLKTRVKFNKYD